MSFLGSLLGLVSTARARIATDKRRRAWLLVLAAWSIGGTGIWVMHFMAMVGFSVTDSPLRFDVPITVASFFIAVITVGIGLFIVGLGERKLWKVFVGGPITGVSVAFMHYTGMKAMNINGSFDYKSSYVVASYAIAIVAATVALWFTIVVRGMLATGAAAVVMGVAVCSMHYTGMYGMQVHLAHSTDNVPGVDVNWFLAPIVLFVLVVVIALASAVMAVPSEREQAEAEAVRRKIAEGQALRADAGPIFGGGPVPGAATAGGETPPGRAFAARAANGIADARRQRGR
ncbi:MHYT domain-containing protein [Dactylosporangium sp. CS-033363]|uniref:MHYT domain-containing protein n=1 Tax=Dactylosporangium sp. CS-033363 TaxID=3239935 RepID=UPI003D8DEA62